MAPGYCFAFPHAIIGWEWPARHSAAEAIEPDPFARASAIGAWRNPPDFVSVNVGEVGWAGTIRAALHAGIGVEAGLSSPADARGLAGRPFAHPLGPARLARGHG